LVETALANNQELTITIQETLIANNEVLARRSEYLPSLSAGVGAGLDRVGRFTSQGRADKANSVAPDLQQYSLGLFASWEVDICGRLRSNASAANYRIPASIEGHNFVVTRLVAEIATKYYELLALDRRLAIVHNSIALQQSALEAVRLQQQAARVTMLAVRRFEAQLQSFQSKQFDVLQRIAETENELNFLCGRFSQHVARSDANFLSIEPPAVRTGVPGQLLENHPTCDALSSSCAQRRSTSTRRGRGSIQRCASKLAWAFTPSTSLDCSPRRTRSSTASSPE
jgi:outer membrane protein TolC